MACESCSNTMPLNLLHSPYLSPYLSNTMPLNLLHSPYLSPYLSNTVPLNLLHSPYLSVFLPPHHHTHTQPVGAQEHAARG